MIQDMDPGTIRDRRRGLGLTQAQLAFALGVTPNTVARWERGEVRPSLGAGRALSCVLGRRHTLRGATTPAPPTASWAELWRMGGSIHGAAMRTRRNPEPPDPRGALPALRAALAAVGQPTVLAGGLAVIAWGVLRFTQDVDAIGLSPEHIRAFAASAQARGFMVPDPLLPDPLPTGRLRKVTVFWPVELAPGVGPMPVDVFVLEGDLLDSAVVRARLTPAGDLVVSVEDLILMKLLAGRPKDHLDTLSLMTAHAARLDRNYIRRWARPLGIVDLWRDHVSEWKSGATGW
ncbi:MAG: helix-turn-helix transcriptional regulator [Planctomycetes bacterium]|nr:helix-turn-helix transcriptional regulator [Planctomycetota bacterium]